jgi:SAM-dependent methyltransferase
MRLSEALLGDEVREVCRLKAGPDGTLGWHPRLRQRYGHFTPDEWYEALLLRLVGPETDWLDVGCGADLFPSNPALARVLADRCRLLVGLDPSDNIRRNPFVHEKAQCMLEDYRDTRRFDLLSLRMVAEHIADPAGAAAALSRLAKPGARVVIYTVGKWAPVTIASAMTPIAVHHAVKRLLWRTDPADTFPTEYRMNTRRALRATMAGAGFVEDGFLRLDDCRTLARWPATSRMELATWRALRAIGLGYPEYCLLGVYRKEKETNA